MAKGIGLIGNFKGKVGNTVGYKLTASNNGQTQGIRVYQPIVKNPKSAGQAEQRAKLSPINATYRALKMVIDRGNESLPYGNKSRLAWLKGALKSTEMPWFEKNTLVNYPVGCMLTKGSLPSLSHSLSSSQIQIYSNGVESTTPVNTVSTLSAALMMGNPTLKLGDQITFVVLITGTAVITTSVFSFELSDTDTTAVSGFVAQEGNVAYDADDTILAYAVIVSRQGNQGEHLRSTEKLNIEPTALTSSPYNEASKTAAIASYRASAASNSDWAEESIQ